MFRIQTFFYIYTIFLIVGSNGDYVHYPEINMHYKFHRNPQTWFNARSTCRNEGAMLAMPKTEAETKVLTQIFSMYPSGVLTNVPHKDFLLMGFHDVFNEGEFITETGQSLQYFYHKFANGQPDNGRSENCGSWYRGGGLNDFPCNVPSVFICQKLGNREVVQLNFDCLSPDPAYAFAAHLNKCYKIHLNPKTWPDARMICHAEGGHLAVIRNKQEESHLVGMFNDANNMVNHVRHKDYALLGFHDMYQEGHFVTATGENLESSGYVNWAIGQPDNAGVENCGSMTRHGTLNDFPCSVPAVFICEHKPNGGITL